MGDAMEYMPKEERQAAMAADPLPRYRQWLIDNGHASEDGLAAIEHQVNADIDEAVEFALASPIPDESELYTDVFAGVSQP
jgi:pyruvate dehydrogenase E1 component alpha subunit